MHITARRRRPGKTNTKWRLVSRDLGTHAKDREMLRDAPEAVRGALTPNTRAIIPVHLYGQMCDVRTLRAAIAHRSDVAIIEDCARSSESSYKGELPGTHSDAAI